jgi:hypothetical protein
MGAGSLALVGLWLFLGQVPGDIFFTNQRSHRIDVNFKDAPRGQIRELRLFASLNQGRDWDLVQTIQPDKDHFVFHAPADGYYWLRVAVVNQQGKQEPPNIAAGPPDQKMVIDTAKPVIRNLAAKRVGSEVSVSWDIQEENPDPASFRLEYLPKGSVAALGTAIPATPGLSGQTQFPVAGGQAVVVKLTLRDLAGNLSYAVAEVSADTVTQTSFNPSTGSGPSSPGVGTAVPSPGSPLELPQPIPLPLPTPPTTPTQTLPSPAAGQVSPPAVAPAPVNLVASPPMSPAEQTLAKASPPSTNTASGSPVAPAPPADLRVIASSKWAPAPPPTPAPTPPAPAPPPLPSPGAIAPTQLVAAGPRKQLPPVQYINQPEFVLEYEVSKVGPSGVGTVELYRTRDDGQNWEAFAYDAEIKGSAKGSRHQRIVRFQEGESDGVYGFILLVKNRAGIGRNPPQPGDVPELRIELDTSAPEAQLFEPVPDPQHPGQLLLRWKVADKNLTPTPVCLEWAEKRDGSWQVIGMDLPNDGSFSWKLPERMPVDVFLRLRARDLAGNETIAITPNPLPVDLHEPEGHLLKVSVPIRHP